jgi:hypothetical protein
MKNIDSLLLNFEPIPENELEGITGGDDFLDKLFAQVFDFTATNLNANTLSVFKKEISDLDSTSIGHQMLQDLYNAKSDKIHVTGDIPINGTAGGQYIKEGNKIYLGNLETNTSDPFYNEALNFTYISHEMFHAYLDNTLYSGYETNASKKYKSDVRSEIDPSMFAFMASFQYDMVHNIAFDDSNSHIRAGGSLAVDSPQNESQTVVKNAWDDIFLNGNFTIANYNIIEKNFYTGTTYNINAGKTTRDIIDRPDDTTAIFTLLSRNESFVKESNLLKAMMNDHLAHPNDIIKTDPNLYKLPTSDRNGDSGSNSGGSSGGAGGGGEYYPQDGTGTNFNWPGTGSGFGNPSGNDGKDGISDKTGLPWSYEDRYPGYSRSE